MLSAESQRKGPRPCRSFRCRGQSASVGPTHCTKQIRFDASVNAPMQVKLLRRTFPNFWSEILRSVRRTDFGSTLKPMQPTARKSSNGQAHKGQFRSIRVFWARRLLKSVCCCYVSDLKHQAKGSGLTAMAPQSNRFSLPVGLRSNRVEQLDAVLGIGQVIVDCQSERRMQG